MKQDISYMNVRQKPIYKDLENIIKETMEKFLYIKKELNQKDMMVKNYVHLMVID